MYRTKFTKCVGFFVNSPFVSFFSVSSVSLWFISYDAFRSGASGYLIRE